MYISPLQQPVGAGTPGYYPRLTYEEAEEQLRSLTDLPLWPTNGQPPTIMPIYHLHPGVEKMMEGSHSPTASAGPPGKTFSSRKAPGG